VNMLLFIHALRVLLMSTKSSKWFFGWRSACQRRG